MAGPPLEIYVQSAECHRGFMENTSEWSRLPHAHCPWSAKFSGSVPFSRTHSFSSLDVLTLAPMQLLAYELPFQSKAALPLAWERYFAKADKADTITFCDATFGPNVHHSKPYQNGFLK